MGVSRWLYPWGYRHAKAELTNQKKIGASWFPYVAAINVTVDGNSVTDNSNCSGHYPFNKPTVSSAKHAYASEPGINQVFKRYSIGDAGVQGIFKGAGLSNSIAKFLF